MPSSEQFTCDTCGYMTHTKSSFTAHLKRKTPCGPKQTNKVDRLVEPTCEAAAETSCETTCETPAIVGNQTQEPTQKDAPKEIVIQCISVETSYLFCDTIYALESLIKKPLSNPEEQTKAQLHVLNNFVKVYYDIVKALQYKGRVVNDLTLRDIKFTESFGDSALLDGSA